MKKEKLEEMNLEIGNPIIVEYQRNKINDKVIAYFAGLGKYDIKGINLSYQEGSVNDEDPRWNMFDQSSVLFKDIKAVKRLEEVK